MDLKRKIDDLLSLEKFNNLDKQQKSMVAEAIYANSLILSEKQREKYFRIIRERLRSIECLGDDNYYEKGICYGGIVKTDVARETIDEDGLVFPFIYDLKYKIIRNHFGKLTKSILHEFGHLTCQKENITLTPEETKSKNNVLHIDRGGLVITEEFKSEYGHMLTETMDEFTTFLSNRAYLGDADWDIKSRKSNVHLKEFAAKYGLELVEESEYEYILYEDLYSSYPEEAMSHDSDYMNSMFNLTYNRYSPLTKLIMHSFQNPMFNEDDLKEAYKKGSGLEVQIEETPINDFFYGYYESSFHTEDIFNELMGNDAWKVFCKEFDSKMHLTDIDYEFIEGSIDYFRQFYEKRLQKYLKEGKITQAQAEERLGEFNKTFDACNKFYFERTKTL